MRWKNNAKDEMEVKCLLVENKFALMVGKVVKPLKTLSMHLNLIKLQMVMGTKMNLIDFKHCCLHILQFEWILVDQNETRTERIAKVLF